jgi:hypothetical protein
MTLKKALEALLGIGGGKVDGPQAAAAGRKRIQNPSPTDSGYGTVAPEHETILRSSYHWRLD